MSLLLCCLCDSSFLSTLSLVIVNILSGRGFFVFSCIAPSTMTPCFITAAPGCYSTQKIIFLQSFMLLISLPFSDFSSLSVCSTCLHSVCSFYIVNVNKSERNRNKVCICHKIQLLENMGDHSLMILRVKCSKYFSSTIGYLSYRQIGKIKKISCLLF